MPTEVPAVRQTLDGYLAKDLSEVVVRHSSADRLLREPDGAPIRYRGQDLVVEIGRAELGGRGGSGFPVATKWSGVAAGSGPRVVVANGAEGEPLSWKDRYLLHHRTDAVLDGLALAAEALGADRSIVFVARDVDAVPVREALRARSDDVEVVVGEDRYVAGEESAVVRGINEGVALPAHKPPRPYEAGVAGQPTLIQNVETLAHVGWIARHGGDGARPATFLMTVRQGGRTELMEVEHGRTLREVGLLGAGYVVGGYFGGVQPATLADVPMNKESYHEAGTALGCLGIAVLDPTDCPVTVAAGIVDYLATESSRQCGVCLNGTRAMADALAEPATADLTKVRSWADGLPGRGACGLIDAACQVVRTVFDAHERELAHHVAGRCASTV